MTAREGPPRGWIVAGVALAALVALALVLLFTGDDPDELVIPPEPTPTPTPTPEPEPEPQPVEGQIASLVSTDLSTAGTGLYQPGQAEDQPRPVDEASVDAFAQELRAWLDEELTRQNIEGEVTFGADLVGSQDVVRLGGPDDPIEEARYHLTVGVRGEPEWAHVLVEVTRADGSTHAVDLAVLPGSPPVLVAAHEATA